jgi:aspartyl-tRNA(Asn)/glutamyl-tRNA(Gln) amidotransferase subunit B
MRSKEEAHDYRYFPEPDLPPLRVSGEWIEVVRKALPELPAARRARFERQHALKAQDAMVLTAERPLADYFEAVAASCGNARAAANWVLTEVLRKVRESKGAIDTVPLAPERLAALIRLVDGRTISGKVAKELFEEIYASGADPADLVRERGLTQVTDEGPISQAIDAVVARNADKVAAYRAGKTGLLGFFVGQVLKETGGQADPALVNRLLKERLES